MTSLNPYLTFNGNCEKAFNFYKSVFGGDFISISRFSEMPDDPNYKLTESDKNKIMHVSLPIHDSHVLMGSDTSEHYGKSLIRGTNITLSIGAENKEEANKLFNALSKDGSIVMPMEDTFWESYFGMCTDQFGIQWMISTEHKPQK